MNDYIVIFTDENGKFVFVTSFTARYAWEVEEKLEERYQDTGYTVKQVVPVDELSPIDIDAFVNG